MYRDLFISWIWNVSFLVVIELLEEDDEFEEFENDWNVNNMKQDEEPQLWQDDWDDDNVVDEFTGASDKFYYFNIIYCFLNLLSWY